MCASVQPPHPPPCLQSRMCASIHPVSLRSLSGPALDFAGVACTGSYLGECTCSAGFGSLDCSQLLGTPVTLYAMGATEFFDPVTVRLCRPPRDVQSTPAIRSHPGDAHPPAPQGSHIMRTHFGLHSSRKLSACHLSRKLIICRGSPPRPRNVVQVIRQLAVLLQQPVSRLIVFSAPVSFHNRTRRLGGVPGVVDGGPWLHGGSSMRVALPLTSDSGDHFDVGDGDEDDGESAHNGRLAYARKLGT